VVVINNLLAVFFRLSGALSKFVLFLYLGRAVDTAQIGLLAIVIAVVAIFVQLVGAEFHYINNREIASSTKLHAAGLIRGQLILHCVSYFLILPMLSLVFFFGLLDWIYFIPILCLLITEHLGQEIFRFLQFRFKPVLGALVLFVRSGLWVFVFIYLVERYGVLPSIQNVLEIWLVFSLLAVFFGGYFIRDYLFERQASKVFSLAWSKNAIGRAMPFFISAACFSLFQYLDRFILELTLGTASVGIMFFLASLASALHLFVSFAVGVFYGPLAIRAFRQKGLDAYLEVRSSFIKKTIAYGLIGVIFALVLISPVLNLVGKADYLSHAYVFYLMLIANAIMIGADFANLDLYVRNMDKEIMFSTVFALLASIVIQTIMILAFGIMGAALGVILSAIGMWIARRAMYTRAITASPQLVRKFRV
jgi:O-antigen/teichoic acid export membrane protein